MLSFNNIYGQPAALMRRRIWSGEERKISGVSAHIANAFKPVRSVSPANFSASMGLYNGRLYFLAKGGNVYTTPDLKTLTHRLLAGGENSIITSIAQLGGVVIVGTQYRSGMYTSYGGYVSVDDGLTFRNALATPRFVRAGDYFYALSSSMVRSKTGLDTAWSATSMPSGEVWSHVLHNGEIYFTLSIINNVFYNAAYSLDGVSFILSNKFANERSKFPSGAYIQSAAVIGKKFVMVGVQGGQIYTVMTENGIDFEQFSQSLESGVEGEEFRSWIIQVVAADGVMYMRAATSDTAGIIRTRVFSSIDGISWRALPAIATRSSLIDPSNGMFELAPGQGIYAIPWADADHAFISDTVNDRDFYYELGAA
ncbi:MULTISPECIES: hypothetical protein [Delftia]|nr:MULTISPECIES: hypothetical protein [Delftia]MCP4018747.1 hypothetical protein [Delftia sp.]MCP4519038.1 hypothetical protein [Delftia sp.]MCP4530613.1 hypothetical protein [Delftia sp.]QPS76640.1 hypothetical protein I6G48_08810 [Delftia acidovorans]